MEGTGVHEVRLIAALLLTLTSVAAFAQDSSRSDSFGPRPICWKQQAGYFLEPNQFSTIKELNDRALWLQIGYGKPLLTFDHDPESVIGVGLEAVMWSRLRILSDFRFPVETADYFFGLYAEWDRMNANRARSIGWPNGESWRFRISHISSHDVDGKDTVHGGSSSHYSREFVELSRQFRLIEQSNIMLTVGVRGYFHQVTKIEPSLAFPCTLNVPIQFLGNDGVFAFVSSAEGPVWPSVAAGFRAQLEITPDATNGLELYYYNGASWAGTDQGAKVSQVKLQLDVRGL